MRACRVSAYGVWRVARVGVDDAALGKLRSDWLYGTDETYVPVS